MACLESPAAVEIPHNSLHADGRSIYLRYGGERYVTRVAGHGGAHARPGPRRPRAVPEPRRAAASSGGCTGRRVTPVNTATNKPGKPITVPSEAVYIAITRAPHL